MLEEASSASEQTVALAVRDGDESVYTARAIAQRSLAVTVPVGRRLPLLSTSTGRAMLTFDTPQEIDGLIESSHPILLTDKTTIDPNLLRRELELVRSRGYALVEQEVEIGVRSLAVPFFDNKQKVAGAITALTSMSALTTKKLLSDILPIVQNVAEQLQIAMKAGRSDIQS
nr:IclR family transcriptional regulator C-terminal domain-containing protein [Rhizobium sp. CG5]